MLTFKENDRVRVLSHVPTYSGMIGEVLGFTEADDYVVFLELDTEELVFGDSELELLTGDNGPTAIDPNHYKFGDVEVRQISGHLTSFGGQALQYIARATRLDGDNKGDAIEDLKKSLRFIQWEIERLEGK